jgi:hypothetical protein
MTAVVECIHAVIVSNMDEGVAVTVFGGHIHADHPVRLKCHMVDLVEPVRLCSVLAGHTEQTPDCFCNNRTVAQSYLHCSQRLLVVVVFGIVAGTSFAQMTAVEVVRRFVSCQAPLVAGRTAAALAVEVVARTRQHFDIQAADNVGSMGHLGCTPKKKTETGRSSVLNHAADMAAVLVWNYIAKFLLLAPAVIEVEHMY